MAAHRIAHRRRHPEPVHREPDADDIALCGTGRPALPQVVLGHVNTRGPQPLADTPGDSPGRARDRVEDDQRSHGRAPPSDSADARPL